MGIYLNPNSISFQRSLNSEIYMDKSSLIAFTNKRINTQQSYLCVSRPRRFGKSMAADMLSAYYKCDQDTGAMFEGLKIQKDANFSKHLNQYHVIKLDMQTFMSETRSAAEMIASLKTELLQELLHAFPDVFYLNTEKLERVLTSVFESTNRQFVLLIDEWDCVMRRYHNEEEQVQYLDFLRNLVKDRPYIALAYMTGILPIKKYGEHSTLNMFYEYSMIDSADISDCFGFTEQEVQTLCKAYDMDFEEAKEWYDGYRLCTGKSTPEREYSIYNPKSVVEAMLRGRYDAYWNQTETYEALKEYIQLNMDGLRDAIVKMLSDTPIPINTRHFQNDMTTLQTKDDVLTLLVHLGYLAYDQKSKRVSIPNKEVAQEFISSIETIRSYQSVTDSIKASEALLEALWDMDEEAVAAGLQKAHEEISILRYNDENSLSCAIGLAFYFAREYYTTIRELPSGKGFADVCFIPRPHHRDKPAVIMELKWDKTVNAAIDQIKSKNYPASLQDYHGNLLLCAINYNRTSKTHECAIETWKI